MWRDGRCLVQPENPSWETLPLLQPSGASFRHLLPCTTETLLLLMGQMMKLPILSSENSPLYIIRSTTIKVSIPNCCQEPATQSIPAGLQGTLQTTSQSLSLHQSPDLSEEQFTHFSPKDQIKPNPLTNTSADNRTKCSSYLADRQSQPEKYLSVLILCLTNPTKNTRRLASCRVGGPIKQIKPEWCR